LRRRRPPPQWAVAGGGVAREGFCASGLGVPWEGRRRWFFAPSTGSGLCRATATGWPLRPGGFGITARLNTAPGRAEAKAVPRAPQSIGRKRPNGSPFSAPTGRPACNGWRHNRVSPDETSADSRRSSSAIGSGFGEVPPASPRSPSRLNRPRGSCRRGPVSHGLRPDQRHRDSARGYDQTPWGLQQQPTATSQQPQGRRQQAEEGARRRQWAAGSPFDGSRTSPQAGSGQAGNGG